MILTITLNPALDKTYTTSSLMAGQVNRMRSVTNIAGGKGINVAKILRQYGYPVMTAGFLGGYAGQFIESRMRDIGAECFFTRVAGETRSSINIVAEDGYVTELLEPGPVITDAELSGLIENYEKAVKDCELVVLSGSVAKGTPADIYGTLIRIGKENGKRCMLDTSGEALTHGIEAAPYMIKPNWKELEYVVGHKLKDIEEIGEAAGRLQTGGICQVLVSMGKKGLLSVSGGEVFWARAPRIKAVNTVGCGDSVVASCAMSLLKRESAYTSLKWAAAVAAANAATLESGVIPLELADELYDKIQIEKL